MIISIRFLTDTDLETADTILKLAFRNSVSRLHDLQLYRQIQPDGWFLASQQENPVGMVGTTNYEAFAPVDFGTDFNDGFGLQQMPPELNTIADLQQVAPLLEARGYSQTDIAAIYGGNWIDVLRRILPA